MSSATGTSFRLVHQSGRRPINEGPAGRRLSCEDLIHISGYGVWPLFNNSIAMGAGAQCRQLDIDSSRAADRAFWQTMPVNVAKTWGGRMPKLTRIWCCHPAGGGAWCLNVITALIEGHTEGRTAMVAEKRGEAERRGEAADIPDGSLTAITFEAAELSEAHEHIDTLGPLVGSSRCLRVFDVPSTVDQKAEVLEEVPVAAEEGQPGPLANLEDIGTIEVPGDLMDPEVLTVWCTRLQELGSTLVARGCRRSLRSLKVNFVDESIVGPGVFDIAVALQSFASAVCIGDVPISFTSAAPRFHLSVLYCPLFPAAPSLILETVLRQLADQAARVLVDVEFHLATPVTPAMLDMARGLAFNKATSVTVLGGDQPAQPAPTNPAPALIEQIQPMPQASFLSLDKHTALAAGIQLASKMPNLRRLNTSDMTEEWAVEAIKAIGWEREFDMVTAIAIRGLGSGDVISIGDHADEFPHITTLGVDLTVPAGVSEFVEFACSSMRSLLQLRCRAVFLQLLGLDADTRSLLESAVPEQCSSVGGPLIVCMQQDNKLAIAAIHSG
ncbi:unnamed protein product [Vitrella brassicaformis CCMP3155]|uniref:Uncharacterized protein n=1 Tax=Vitrella brassicaformis (strain CCMP3155) TaxID=1169540 RepID=A0A0G4GRW0_VITBC|nr:unnamed protein product [Vitrella brassicaformis CCMP3155]|eukprot:CEM33093.1 unnamed protein product [Vitrella brassicaformis CCMP3155]